MKWFGESWGAPVCELTEHIETPVGSTCLDCRTTIGSRDQGVVIPHVGSDTITEEPFHLTCFLVAMGLEHWRTARRRAR